MSHHIQPFDHKKARSSPTTILYPNFCNAAHVFSLILTLQVQTASLLLSIPY